MREYSEMDRRIKKVFGDRVTIEWVEPLHDEDFEPGYAYCVRQGGFNVIYGSDKMSFEKNVLVLAAALAKEA